MSDRSSNKEMEYFFRQDDRLLLLSDFLDKAEKMQVKKGGNIIASCQPVDHLYYLTKGIAHHSILTPQGKERIIHVLIAPSLCAESLFFLGESSDSSEQIVAKTDCTLYRFDRALVDELLTTTLPELNRVIINWLSDASESHCSPDNQSTCHRSCGFLCTQRTVYSDDHVHKTSI